MNKPQIERVIYGKGILGSGVCVCGIRMSCDHVTTTPVVRCSQSVISWGTYLFVVLRLNVNFFDLSWTSFNFKVIIEFQRYLMSPYWGTKKCVVSISKFLKPEFLNNLLNSNNLFWLFISSLLRSSLIVRDIFWFLYFHMEMYLFFFCTGVVFT